MSSFERLSTVCVQTYLTIQLIFSDSGSMWNKLQWKRRHAQFGPSRHNFERDQTNALGTGEHILLGECATALNVLTLLCTLKKKKWYKAPKTTIHTDCKFRSPSVWLLAKQYQPSLSKMLLQT